MYILGEHISEMILKEVEQSGLDMAKCRGQAYDGAPNMSGAVRGCAARISQLYPKALYQHCRSHVLNLAIMKVSKSIPEMSMLVEVILLPYLKAMDFCMC